MKYVIIAFEDRAKLSFEKTFDCSVNNIITSDKTVTIGSACKDLGLGVSYIFSDVPALSYKISNFEDEDLKELTSYFISSLVIKEVEFVRVEDYEPSILVYKVDDRVIIVKSDPAGFRIHLWCGEYYPPVCEGDAKPDKKIDILDLIMVGLAFGSKCDDATCSSGHSCWDDPTTCSITGNWKPTADLTEPWGQIDILDVIIVANRYGGTCP